MPSLAESRTLAGFFGYSRQDDKDSRGNLTSLRERIRQELRGQLGHDDANFKLFQDVVPIPNGARWEKTIRDSIAESVFVIPIMTPTAINSSQCKREFDMFLARERELRRDNLIFPILYIPIQALEKNTKVRQADVLEIIRARQYVNWTNLRHRDVYSQEFGVAIENFCRNICDALHLPTPHEPVAEVGVGKKKPTRLLAPACCTRGIRPSFG
jgi:hypothetical protein